jgi:DNA-binding CsgD family transcriptional regulator
MTHTARQESKGSPIAPEFGLVIMDSSLKPIGFDRGGATILNLANKPANHAGGKREQGACIPKEILQEIGKRKPTDLGSIKTHISLGKREYTCGAYLLEACKGSSAKPVVALRFERVSSADEAVTDIAAGYKLTDREREVLEGVSLGLTNKQLADRLKVSPYTVKIFVHTLMIKMRVKTRGGITAKLFSRENTENRVSVRDAAPLARRLAG